MDVLVYFFTSSGRRIHEGFKADLNTTSTRFWCTDLLEKPKKGDVPKGGVSKGGVIKEQVTRRLRLIIWRIRRRGGGDEQNNETMTKEDNL